MPHHRRCSKPAPDQWAANVYRNCSELQMMLTKWSATEDRRARLHHDESRLFCCFLEQACSACSRMHVGCSAFSSPLNDNHCLLLLVLWQEAPVTGYENCWPQKHRVCEKLGLVKCCARHLEHQMCLCCSQNECGYNTAATSSHDK